MPSYLVVRQPVTTCVGFAPTSLTLYYGQGSTRPSDEGLAALLRALDRFGQVNAASVRIDTHTDATASRRSNRILSQQRADWLATEIRAFSAHEWQIEATGHGEDLAAAKRSTRYTRQKERRADITISCNL